MTDREKQDALVAFLKEHDMAAVCVINYKDGIGSVHNLDRISESDVRCIVGTLCDEAHELLNLLKD